MKSVVQEFRKAIWVLLLFLLVFTKVNMWFSACRRAGLDNLAHMSVAMVGMTDKWVQLDCELKPFHPISAAKGLQVA
jgi:hypothetical protein